MNNFLNKTYKYFIPNIKSITIKQANIFTTLVIFFFTMIFVTLLAEEMYKDYKVALEKTYMLNSDKALQNDVIEKNHKRLKSLMIKTVLVMVTLSFIIFAVFLGLNNLFNKLLNRDTQTFLDFFERAAHNDQVINPNMIFFKDFQIMVGYANEMVTKINEQKYSLQELNLGLESRVKTKTAALEMINKNLEEEKKFSQDLLKSQKEFLRYTVHETNTPLSVILTSIELFTMKNKKDRQLSKIEAAVKNIFNIYDDLSYLVKKDQVSYPKKVIDLGQYLESRVDFFTEVAQLAKLEFVYIPHAKKHHIYFNETKLQRVIDNTLTNAIKYTLINEKIYINLKYFGSFVDMEISSKSKIIKDTEKVFDAYYREEEKREGFGLGLKLVSSICKEESVEIFVASSEDKTSFTYRFVMMGD